MQRDVQNRTVFGGADLDATPSGYDRATISGNLANQNNPLSTANSRIRQVEDSLNDLAAHFARSKPSKADKPAGT